MTEAAIRALIAALEAELAHLPAVQEAGRVFSAANEQVMRAAVTALNQLLAQVSAPPDVTQAPPAAPPVAAAHPVPPQFARPVIVAQSITPPIGTPGSAKDMAAHLAAVKPAGHDATPAATFAAMVKAHDASHSAGAGHIHPGQAQDAYSAPVETIAQESVVPLSEAGAKGKGLIRIITPGWGSSGYYSESVLERDAPKAWPAGTKMFWDHPTVTDAQQRPERSLRDLAAELTEEASYMKAGPDGPGVYGRAKVFSAYQPKVEELAPHIGVSIRSSASIRQGEAEGRKGPIVERLIPSPTNSVDFVTIPGRGGRVAALFEAARGANSSTEDEPVSEAELKEAREALATMTAERDRATLGLALMQAHAIATEAVAKVDIPDLARARVVAAVESNPPMKDGALDAAALKAAVEKAATDEKAYLDKVRGVGVVRGMGSGTSTSTEAGDASLVESFRRMGMTEQAAKIAAAGRR